MDSHPVGPLMLSMSTVTKDCAESHSKNLNKRSLCYQLEFCMQATQWKRQHSSQPNSHCIPKNKIYLGNATWVHGGHLNCMLLKNCSVILLILLPSSAHYCGNCRGFSCIFLTMEHVASLLPFHCQREGVCPRLSSLHHLCSLWCCSQVRSSKHSVFFQLTSGFSVIKNLIGDINPLTWFVLPDNVTVWIEWKHVLLIFYSFKRWRDNMERQQGSGCRLHELESTMPFHKG